MGIVVAIKYEEDNIFLQLSGKTEAAKWLPLLLVKQEITEKVLLADVRGGVSLVIAETELDGFMGCMPDDVKPEVQNVGLVEITGYGLQADAKTLYEVLERAGTIVNVMSVSDTVLTLVIPSDRGADCLKILQNHFGDRIE
ncbi:MAG: hypothetical protein IJ325_08865 [Clostridia bacterium]|nr:hypothetical protein [Clostridia bacterium]